MKKEMPAPPTGARTRLPENEYIIQTRIQGERTIAIVRLVTLAVVFVFALFVFFNRVGEIGLVKALLDLSFLTNMGSVGIAVAISLWVLRLTGRKDYRDWMKWVLPLTDITLVNIVSFANAGYNNQILLITGAPVFFYFVFLVITVFRNSPASVILTGAYAAVSYVFLSFYAQLRLDILKTGGNLFRNSFGYTLIIMQDDEVLKALVMLLVTGICALLARRFNRMVADQTALRLERQKQSDELSAALRDITKSVLESSGQLTRTSERLSTTIGELIDSGRKIGSETRDEFEKIETSAAAVIQLIRSVEAVSRSIGRQAEFVTESSRLIEDMGRSTGSVRDTARRANEIAAGLLKTAENGGAAVTDVVVAVKETEASSKRIGEVLKIIAAIAEQTNMLAMNAAIEAAHAGDAGRGFAIVAREVRQLSEESSRNAGVIEEFVKEIRERVRNIVELSAKTMDSFRSILADTRKTTDINRDVLTAMEKETVSAKNAVEKIENLRIISEEVRIAGEEQAGGGQEILSSITVMKEKAESVIGLTEKQIRMNGELDGIRQELAEMISRNQSVAESLEGLVSRF